MKNVLATFAQSKKYWAFILILSLAFETVALYYQYVLDEWPCVLCIHIRIWIAGIILVAIAALLTKSGTWLSRGLHLINTIVMIGFVERSWQVLAVERGWIFSDCNMESGLPNWFALDKWFPVLFEVKTSCGYTPLIVAKISMAEILMVTSAGLLVLSILLLLSAFINSRDN